MSEIGIDSREKLTKYSRSENLSCVDLFCGAGGLTHGLIDGGINVVAGVDYEKACKHPIEANHPGIKFLQTNVAELKASKVREWFGDAKVRVLAGCVPCQPFSRLSPKSQRLEDKRLSLLDHFGRLVGDLVPEIVVMENVPSVMRAPVFQNFKATLESLGYHVSVEVIDCSKYGLPQRRSRALLLASRFGEIKVRDPHESESARTLKDAIGGLPPLIHGEADAVDRMHRASRLGKLNHERILASKPGGTRADWPEHLRHGLNKPLKNFVGSYGRMKYDEPSPTLTTQFYGFSTGRCGHPSQARALSLREGALLQGFPMSFSFVPNGSPVYFSVIARMIGNAVPVTLGRVIGQSIIEHLKPHVFSI